MSRFIAANSAASANSVALRWRTWAGVALIGLATLVAVIGLVRTDESRIGPYGLIDALPPLYYLAVLVVLLTLLLALRKTAQPTAVMASAVMALVVLVQGSASFVESEARFPVAWLHAGFIDSIITLGHTTPSFDARFSWPGFFSAGAVLTEATGVSDATVWLRWAPIVLTMCYLPPLLAIGRATLPGWRAPWIGLTVFIFADWVGQDYFAPQTVAYILMLSFVAVLLTWFRHREPGRFSSWLQARARAAGGRVDWLASMVRFGSRDLEPAEVVSRAGQRVGLVAVLALLALAMVPSHQLTPAVLIASGASLAVLGRLRPWPIVIFVFVVMLSWLSYAAYPFWSGHLSEIFGSIGKIGQVFDSGVSERIQGGKEHLLVLRVRIVFALLVWGLAGLGAIRLWRSGRRVSVALLVLMIAPIFIAGSQGYGGEGILRMFFFSLPAASLLIAGLALPLSLGPSRPALLVFVLAVAIAFPMFLLAKWGNEDFERIAVSDVQLTEQLYQIAPLGSTLMTLGYGGVPNYQNLTAYSYAPNLLSAWPITNVSQVDKLAGNNPIGTYIVISRPEVAYGVINDGLPADFASQLVTMLVASKQYEIVYKNDSGVILKRLPAPASAPATGAAPIPAAVAAHSGVARSAAADVGAVTLVLPGSTQLSAGSLI